MFGFWRRGTDRTRGRALREHRLMLPASDRGRKRFGLERDWEEQLLLACETLASSPEDVISAISTSGTLSDSPWEVASLMVLAERLSDELGWRVSVDIDANSFTVRFSRVTSNHPGTGLDSAFHHDEQAGGLTRDARP